MQRGAASPGRAVMRATPANGEMREAGRRVFEAEEIGSGQDRSAGAGSNRARPPASVSPTATGREGRTSQTSSLASSRDSLKNSLVLTVSNGPVALKSNGCGDYDLPLRASGKTQYDTSRNRSSASTGPFRSVCTSTESDREPSFFRWLKSAAGPGR